LRRAPIRTTAKASATGDRRQERSGDRPDVQILLTLPLGLGVGAVASGAYAEVLSQVLSPLTLVGFVLVGVALCVLLSGCLGGLSTDRGSSSSLEDRVRAADDGPPGSHHTPAPTAPASATAMPPIIPASAMNASDPMRTRLRP
jgi:hypothetical protein